MGLRQPPVPRGYNKPFRGAKVQRLSQNAYLTREQKVSTGYEFWIFNYRSNLLQIMQPRNLTSVHQANLPKTDVAQHMESPKKQNLWYFG